MSFTAQLIRSFSCVQYSCDIVYTTAYKVFITQTNIIERIGCYNPLSLIAHCYNAIFMLYHRDMLGATRNQPTFSRNIISLYICILER